MNIFLSSSIQSLRHQLAQCRITRCLCIAAIVLPLHACAALPDVNYTAPAAPVTSSPTVTNGQGQLTAKRSKSVLSQRLSKSGIEIQTLAAIEEAATGEPLIAGNKVTLLFDGPQTMTAMLAAIATAKEHINLETYIFDQDEMGLRFADLLIEKQKSGVHVNIIYDSVGTIGTPAEFFTRMREAGIHMVAFNPVNPLARLGHWELNSRDHRKILIVDGNVAFTGGVNISGDYSKSSLFRSRGKPRSDVGWRDTHIKIEGPAVAALQWTFLESWASQEAGDLPDHHFFPPLKEVGDKVVRVLASAPGGDFDIYKAYVLAMEQSKKSIHITSAYFVPDPQTVQALIQAAKRGVDVKVIVPGVSDSKLLLYAGRSFYSQLLEGGVKVYELQVAVLHAKTAVIDGLWSTVGSTNMDMRSFVHNNEINVVVMGDSFGLDMDNAFNEDLRGSHEITLDKWQQRPFGERIREWGARRLNYWL